MKINKFKCVAVLGLAVFLSSCGGGGGSSSVPVGDDGVPNSFADLKQVLPYFMDKSEHDVTMVQINILAILSQQPHSFGSEGGRVCVSGSRNEKEIPQVVSGMVVTTFYDVEHVKCVNEKGGYHDGSIRTKTVTDLGSGSMVTDTEVTKLVNTDYPRIINSDLRDNPLGVPLRSVKVAVTSSGRRVMSLSDSRTTTTTTTTIDQALFRTDKGDELVVHHFDTKVVSEDNGNIATIKKYSVLAAWNMVNDASHNRMVATSPFGAGAGGLTRTLAPGHYTLRIEIIEDLVFEAGVALPIAGSYQVDLEDQGISLVTEFNDSGVVVTHTKNGLATVSRLPR